MIFKQKDKVSIKILLDNIYEIFIPENGYEIVNELKRTVFISDKKEKYLEIKKFKHYKNNQKFINFIFCDTTPIFGLKCELEVRYIEINKYNIEILKEEIVFMENF